MNEFDFSRAVLTWHDQHGRKHLPWQQNISAYRVWLSEIMLQQTQVATVIPYFDKFLQHFPSVQQLANAPIDEVLHLWTGLGYYARARNLHACAKKIVAEFNGEFPKDVEQLSALPGIGRSTAAAIASITWNTPAAILDGNVKRVLARFYAVDGWPGENKVAKRLWALAEANTPQKNAGQYSQAMMDLGATLCVRSRPQCGLCPVNTHCQAFSQGNPGDYPGKKPRKVMPVKSVQMLMLENPAGEFLLQQRPSTGIWGGLWGFPELASGEDAQRYAEIHWGRATLAETWSTYRHTFSHYHLDITPIWLRLPKAPNAVAEAGRIWYNTRQPAALGLAAPVKKLLQQLTERAQASLAL